MTGMVVALCAATGTYLVYTALVMGRPGFPGWVGVASGFGRVRGRMGSGTATSDWLAQAGLLDVRPGELLGRAALLGAVGLLGGLVVFGALLPAIVLAVWVALGWPLASCRLRRERLRAAAQESWPRLIEEIRIRTANLGRSVPQALFEAGASAGAAELRPAFDAAHREWLLSTDFERTVAVLKNRLADPTADAACETLLVAHQVGGNDLAARLEALAADRILDVQGRKDARARQAGVRFSRRFVLLVPCGMALVGTTIGSGRAAYGTSWGQTMVMLGVVVIAVCWLWAGRLLKLPSEERVFR